MNINEDNSIEELVNHLYFDRLLPILPIYKEFESYNDIEAKSLFLACRSLILSLSIHHGLEAIVEETINLIETIMKNAESITSPALTSNELHSICVVIRLLSDSLEYAWTSQNDVYNNENDFLAAELPNDVELNLLMTVGNRKNETVNKNKLKNMGAGGENKFQTIDSYNYAFSGVVVGFSTHKPNFHMFKPKKLSSKIAKRLLQLCSRIKFGTLTHKIVSNLTRHNTNYTAYSRNALLPNNEYFERRISANPKCSFLIENKIDITIFYIQQYVGASNTTDFGEFLKSHATHPAITFSDEVSKIIIHFDLYGCTSISKNSLMSFLEVARQFNDQSSKSIFTCTFLYYAARSLIYWLISKPLEYQKLMASMKEVSESDTSEKFKHNEETIKLEQLTETINSTFEEIFTGFNLIHALTSQNSEVKNNDNSTASVKNDRLRHSHSHSSQTSSEKSTSSSSTSQDLQSPASNYGNAFRELTFSPTLRPSTLSPNPQYAFPTTKLIKNPVSPAMHHSATFVQRPSSLDHSSEVHSKTSTFDFNHDEVELDKSKTMDDISSFYLKNESLTKYQETEDIYTSKFHVLHLTNILELYSAFDDSDYLLHTAAMKFLSTLLLLDYDALTHLNSTHFKCLDNDVTISSSNAAEKEKSLSVKNLTHGFRKLTSFSPPKVSKSVKFFTILSKIFNGAQEAPDVSIIYSIKGLLTFYSVASTISTIDKFQPACILAKRIFRTLGSNLKIGDSWNSPELPHISNALNRKKNVLLRLQLEYFSSSLQLSTDEFLHHLNLSTKAASIKNEQLVLHTEGFRAFFCFPCGKDLKEKTVKATSEFLKTVFSNVADFLIKDYEILDDLNVIDLIDSIVDGTVLNKINCYSKHHFLNGDALHLNALTEFELSETPSSSSGVNDGLNGQEKVYKVLSIASAPVSPESMLNKKVAKVTSASMKFNAEALNHQKKTHSVLNQNSSEPITKTSTPISISSTPIQKVIKSPFKLVTGKSSSYDSTSKLHKTMTFESVDDSASEMPVISPPIEIDAARRVLSNIFSIFKTTATYSLFSYADFRQEMVSSEFKRTIKPIFVAIIDGDARLRTTAKSFMNLLISDMSKLSRNSDPNLLKGFYLICRYTATLFAAGLIEIKTSNDRKEILLDILTRLLNIKSQLGVIVLDVSGVEEIKKLESAAFLGFCGTIGRGLHLTLYSNIPKIQKLLTAAYAGFYKVILFHRDYIGDISSDWSGNVEFIESLSKNNYVSLGSVSFQRNLKQNIHKYVIHANEVIFDSFQIMFERWLELSKTEIMTPNELADFRSLAGILASFSGILSAIPKTGSKNLKIPSESVVQCHKKIKYFVLMQCKWLSNKNLITRENSKEILSSELHQFSFESLFKNMGTTLTRLQDTDLVEKSEECNMIQLEQFMQVLKLILSREYTNNMMFYYSLDIISLIDQLIRVVCGLSQFSEKYFKASMYLAKVFISMHKAEKSLGLRGHIQLKNKWLKLVIKNFHSAITKDIDFENLSKPIKEMDLAKRDLHLLYLDSAIECAKVIAYLTADLPLEFSACSSEEEAKRSVGLLFQNYLSILMKGISISSNSNYFPTTLKHKLAMLNDNLIECMTNLSNANVEQALQYTLPLGLSTIKEIKVSFLQAFVNVVENYPNRKITREAAKVSSTEELVQYLIQFPELILHAAKVCPNNEIDEFSAGLLSVFQSRNAAHDLIKHLLVNEIESVTNCSEILRRNSIATRTLALFARSKGITYLKGTLKPSLLQLSKNDCEFGIDKNNEIVNGQNELQYFMKALRLILNAISESSKNFPPALVLVCQTIAKAVDKKFPEYSLIAVGSFVFLRFLCPALVSPDTDNIVDVTDLRIKRLLIHIVKVIQNIANGSTNSIKWKALAEQHEFLEKCNKQIFEFLSNVSNPKLTFELSGRDSPKTVSFDMNFFHKFLYTHELEARREAFNSVKSIDELPTLKKSIILVDNVLRDWGQPAWEYNDEIPPFIKNNIDRFPQLYEFMSRFAFRKDWANAGKTHYINETMAKDGKPVITLSLLNLTETNFDEKSIIYKIFQVYARFWSAKHYLVIDLTEYYPSEQQLIKLISLFFSLLPHDGILNCSGCYHLNATESFLESWDQLFHQENPFVRNNVSIHFVNSIMDHDILRKLGLASQINELISDIRVNLEELQLFDNISKTFMPVSMRIGKTYIQILEEKSKSLKNAVNGNEYEIYMNHVYKLSHLSKVYLSQKKRSDMEFTISIPGYKDLILFGSKCREIVKMISYGLKKMADDMDLSSDAMGPNSEVLAANENDLANLAHILLIVLVSLYHEDDCVKNVAYNLLATTQKSFELDFGIDCRSAPEMFVLQDCSVFLNLLFKSISKSMPNLTLPFVKLMIEALANKIIPSHCIPQSIACLSYWIPNIYCYVFLQNEEDGMERLSFLIQSLISLTIDDSHFTYIYLQQIWYPLAIDDRITSIVVDEVIRHALERDSENRDWTKALPIITGLTTVDVTSVVVAKLFKIIDSFLPSLKMEVTTQSWSELGILVKISVPLFFESALMSQAFLPEILFIISLLLDQGPITIRSAFHELLLNVCHSLSINQNLPEHNKNNLDKVCSLFSSQKLKFIAGFNQDDGSIFKISTFSSKFNTLEHLISNVLFIMDNADRSESIHWKTRYKKYLMDTIFNRDSFLSGRAMMILGIMGKSSTSETLCKNLLSQSQKVFSDPHVSDEQTFLLISHIFSYSKFIEGLDPSLTLYHQMFWLSTCLVDSPHPIVFEGGLSFLSNCLKKLYMYKFDNVENYVRLSSDLLKSRSFAESYLLRIESLAGIIWTADNFSQVLISMIIRGLFISFAKPSALEMLEQLFRNSYYEHRICSESKDYYSYLFMHYLLSTPEQFTSTLNATEFTDEMFWLDPDNQIPMTVFKWLSSNSKYSNFTLRQAAILFNSTSIDELIKFRFVLVVRELLRTSPVCIFKLYLVIKEELRRLSKISHHINTVMEVYEIVSLMIKQKEYPNLVYHNEDGVRELEELASKNYSIVSEVNSKSDDILMGIQRDPELLFERKRLITTIMSRISCFQ